MTITAPAQPSLFDEMTIAPLDWIEARDYREHLDLYYATERDGRAWADYTPAQSARIREAYQRVTEWRDTTRTWPDKTAYDRWDALWWGFGTFVVELDTAQEAKA